MIKKPTGDCDHCDRKDVDIHKRSPLGGDYCYYCNEERKDSLKEEPTSTTYYPKQRIKSKSKPKSKQKRKVTGEAAMFIAIWRTRKHVSFLSGKKLNYVAGSSFWFNLFAHVLPKGRYPNFRLRLENIVLLTPEEHELFDTGTEARRQKYAEENNCDWQELYDLVESMKLKYESERINN